MSSLSIVLIVFAAIVGGAVLALLAAMTYFRAQIGQLNSRMDRSESAKAKANEMLLQARAQVEVLQQDLIDARRNGVIQAASASARASAASAAEAKAAKDKAKADLVRQLDANDRPDKVAQGFADTQPMTTGFGAMVRR
jgi:F0F1-type ATP synthase membrane subunit b/b'